MLDTHFLLGLFLVLLALVECLPSLPFTLNLAGPWALSQALGFACVQEG